jgi:hypothetical protein
MKKVLIGFILFFSAVSMNAQRTTFMNMDKTSRMFYDSVFFVNPKFYPGVVISIDGKQSGGSINICTVNQKLYLLSPENDTLMVNNQETIDRVYILGKAYVNSKYGFVEMLETTGDVTLCELRITEIHTDAAPDAYGLKTHTKSSKKMTAFTIMKEDAAHDNFSYTELSFDINSDFAFSYYKKPFLLVKGEAYPLTKKSLIKYFPKQKEFIQEYMKEHNTNIHSVAPVFELFSNLKQKINH